MGMSKIVAAFALHTDQGHIAPQKSSLPGVGAIHKWHLQDLGYFLTPTPLSYSNSDVISKYSLDPLPPYIVDVIY